jgi:predicted phage terminase large subunit-like protein
LLGRLLVGGGLMQAVSQAYMAYPHTYAERVSEGLWVAYPHLRIVSLKIVQLIDAGGGTLLVSMPPRHGKSELISRWTPEWFLRNYATKRVLLLSYAAEMAEGWSRRARNGFAEHGGQLADDKRADNWWFTAQGGDMSAAGLGGPITGKGGHLIIIDDPVKNAEEADSETIRQKHRDAFDQDVFTRREKGCVLIVLMTRWREDDLYAYVKERIPDAVEITMPLECESHADPLGRKPGDLLCPDRVDAKMAREIKEVLTSRAWIALYQQRPTAAEGAEIKRSWWRYYDELPITWQEFEYRLSSWDATFTDASTSDWVVGQVWGVFGGQRYLLDQVRERMTFVETCAAIAKTHELAANGQAIVNSLQVAIPSVYGVKVGNNGKVARVRAVSPQIHAGNVLLPKHAKFSDELVEESAAFPLGKHDDCVDALSQALSELAHFTGIPVSHLTPTDDRFVPAHVRELQQKGVLGGAFRAPKSWRL